MIFILPIRPSYMKHMKHTKCFDFLLDGYGCCRIHLRISPNGEFVLNNDQL